MRDERAYLTDMLESAFMIQRFIAVRSRDDFMADQLLQEGVLRRLGVIGEAASKISEATRAQSLGPPWTQIIRMRNVLVHIYFGVELQIAWDTASTDLQPLIDAVQTYLQAMDDTGAAGPQA